MILRDVAHFILQERPEGDLMSDVSWAIMIMEHNMKD